MTEDEQEFSGSEQKSSTSILAALKKAEDAFREWNETCRRIDDIYSIDGVDNGVIWDDADLDLFWSSFEVLKPAIYARPPQPVVAPLFKDGKPLHNLTAELLERCAISTFQRTDINDVMIHLRDDLLFAGRGSPWVRYEHDGDGHSVCVEHKDRLDFLHEPSRKWSEVGWVAGAAWLTRKDMRKRFAKTSGKAYQDATYSLHRENNESGYTEKRAVAPKTKVWEVWHKAENRVFWVTDGVDVVLDEGAPDVQLSGFFPCPKPAYGTLRRRSLVPIPDWQRYSVHFKKISELTRRIYALLDKVRMKGLIPAGGDIGDAIENLIRDDSDEILIPVPSAAMMTQGAGFVSWMPLSELAQAIQGLIDARTQLINDFYQLSGISDIMRGATEADETLGAQQLKTQYGSVRVREKSSELQRVGADVVKIASEIIAQKFPAETMLEMSGLSIPKKAAIEKRVKEIEGAAKEELAALGEKAKAAAQQAQGQEIDPQQAEQAMQQAQQGIIAKYAEMLHEAEQQVPLEDVVELLRDGKSRSFVFEIESSSTILTDELQEKQSRNEFMGEFAQAQQALMGLAGMGEPGAKLAGSLMKFVLAPYRAGRELDGAIDEFIDAAPEMAKAAGGNDALAEANNKLAEAEMVKARAAMAAVEARSQADRADMQRKVMEIQQKGAIEADKHQRELEKMGQQVTKHETDAADARALLEAQLDKLRADTYAILVKAGVAKDQQALDEFQSVADVHARSQDQAMAAQRDQVDTQFRERGETRADQQFAQQESPA